MTTAGERFEKIAFERTLLDMVAAARRPSTVVQAAVERQRWKGLAVAAHHLRASDPDRAALMALNRYAGKRVGHAVEDAAKRRHRAELLEVEDNLLELSAALNQPGLTAREATRLRGHLVVATTELARLGDALPESDSIRQLCAYVEAKRKRAAAVAREPAGPRRSHMVVWDTAELDRSRTSAAVYHRAPLFGRRDIDRGIDR